MTDTLPELWTDWCTVVGIDPTARDRTTLTRFENQAGPSRRVLHVLQPRTKLTANAPAWPSTSHAGHLNLDDVLQAGTRLSAVDVGWRQRLILRRLLFVAVLLAPADQGGLALDRAAARDLTPRILRLRRLDAGTAEDARECPACAVWTWLEVLGASSAWSRSMVRELLSRQAVAASDEHRHTRPDPYPEWEQWPDYANLVPSIDRWGWMKRYGSLHRSSISAVIADIERLVDEPVPHVAPRPEPAHRPDREPMTEQDEAEIMSRADEVLARVSEILRQYGR